MNKLIIAAALLFSSISFAADSTWLLCKGEGEFYSQARPLVVNVYEHRSGADDRETEFTLIFGGHTITGSLLDSKGNSEVDLGNKSGAWYSGTAEVDLLQRSLVLKGNLFLSAESTPLSAYLECETIRTN